ncbi:alkaline phosphatase PhoX, partial [Cutibacterium acnes]
SLMEDSNRSDNPSIHDVSDPARRRFVQGSLASAAAALFGGGLLAGCATGAGSTKAANLGRDIGFASVPMRAVDDILVPPGYTARVLYRWGDPVGVAGAMPAFKPDATNTADEQALQAGMHHDGMSYFPLDGSK